MNHANTAIDLAFALGIGLFVGGFSYLFMRAFGIASPASEAGVDGGARFDVPRTVELDSESRLHVHGSVACCGVNVERDQGERGVPVIASACEAKIRAMGCADVCEAGTTYSANRFSFHDQTIAVTETNREGSR